MKLIKMLDLLARPTRFELVNLGLEMRWIGYTNYIVLHRFVILQYLFYNVSTKNGLNTHLPKLRNLPTIADKGDKQTQNQDP